jgi:hypothetical protein
MIGMISVVVEPMSIKRAGLFRTNIPTKVACACQFADATPSQHWQADGTVMKQPAPHHTRTGFCLAACCTLFKIAATPSRFDGKQSHNSPVIVTAN